ncbi:CTP-dependent riboflavin kinase [Mongoliitalea daihaiensis]|uniref:CTP-dependent riboflavin kinase n=1 Tax=Mongoliitalea daihaiensis TaxID=2782006 RepID=UPI001F2AAC77|nr:CTP-dependent riboflavin kinase [Mongoliitalea daihaiensis]UJP64177.1 DUF120 domain-containing protein [Mongoliitalea daihaiensis]
MSEIIYTGSIVQGRGIGKSVIEKYQSRFEKEGLEFYPGTLNIILKHPVYLDLKQADFSFDDTWYLFQAKVNNYPCYLLRFPKCPDHILEVVADTRLKSRIEFENEHGVKVDISGNYFLKATLKPNIFWRLFWWKRESWFYKGNRYQFLVGKLLDFNKKVKNLLMNKS